MTFPNKALDFLKRICQNITPLGSSDVTTNEITEQANDIAKYPLDKVALASGIEQRETPLASDFLNRICQMPDKAAVVSSDVEQKETPNASCFLNRICPNITPFDFSNIITNEVTEQARDIARHLPDKVSLASSGGEQKETPYAPEIHDHYKVNPEAVKQYEPLKIVEAISDKEVKTAETEASFPKSETFYFPSKLKREPDYACSVSYQKPEDKLCAVSVYLVETYLGRYAFRRNFYFRKKNEKAAKKCYTRAIRTVRELIEDMQDETIPQTRIPYVLRKRLSPMDGEIEPKTSSVATYLDSKNTVEPVEPTIIYLQQQKKITDEFDPKDLEEKK